jgi:hypothetical protein
VNKQLYRLTYVLSNKPFSPLFSKLEDCQKATRDLDGRGVLYEVHEQKDNVWREVNNAIFLHKTA